MIIRRYLRTTLFVLYGCALLTKSALASSFCELNPSSCKQLIHSLQGKWQLKAWNTDNPNASYSDIPSGLSAIKIYWKNEFYFISYSPEGTALETIAGELQVTGHNTIEENITIYSPYSLRTIAYGTKNQMVVSSGKSMVGAKVQYQIQLDDDILTQDGVLTQNVPEGEDPEMFGPRLRHHRYVRVLQHELVKNEVAEK